MARDGTETVNVSFLNPLGALSNVFIYAISSSNTCGASDHKCAGLMGSENKFHYYNSIQERNSMRRANNSGIVHNNDIFVLASNTGGPTGLFRWSVGSHCFARWLDLDRFCNLQPRLNTYMTAYGTTFIRVLVVLTLIAFLREGSALTHAFPTNPNALFPNVTFKNIKTDFGASCDGSGTNDAAAFANWLRYGIAQGSTQVGLVIPTGSNCVGCRYVWNGTNGDPGIQNAIIWAYQATCTSISTGLGDGGERIGSGGFYEDTTHSSLIQTTNLGDTSVTLRTASEASRYSVGDWLLIGALELQTCCGFPPNFQFYQFVQVIGINTGTGVISISPAINSSWFKSTYPSIESDAGMPNNGPASIFKMQPNWNTNLQVFWLNTSIRGPLTGAQDIIDGRSVSCTHCTFGSENTSTSSCQSCTLNYVSTKGQEIDKDIENFTLLGSTVRGNLTFQSPTPLNAVVTSTNVTGSLNGFPLNGTFTNNTFNVIFVGTTNYGHVNNNVFVNNTFSTALFGQHYAAASWLNYNNDGTFSISKTDPNYSPVIQWAVPGFKYAFADGDGTLNSSPTTSFTITDVTDQGTSIKIWTDLPNTLPTPTCNFHPCPVYQSYAGGVITQAGGSPIDLTQYAPP